MLKNLQCAENDHLLNNYHGKSSFHLLFSFSTFNFVLLFNFLISGIFSATFFAFSNRLFVQRSVTHTKNKEENNIDECMYAIMTKIILAIKIRLTESVKSAKVRHYVIGW